MDKKTKYLIMKQLATMRYIHTDYGDVDLSSDIDLQVDIGQLIDRHVKRKVKAEEQLDIFANVGQENTNKDTPKTDHGVAGADASPTISATQNPPKNNHLTKQ